jgi:hypothetical protein
LVPGRREKLREALVTLLDEGEGETPEERGQRLARLGTTLSWVLEELMIGQPGWDERFLALDGVAIQTLTRPSPDRLHVVGAAYVMNGRAAEKMRPVDAKLARPPAASRVAMAAADREIPYEQGWERRLMIPPDPETWRHVFEVDLSDGD